MDPVNFIMSYWGLNRGQDIQGLCVSPPFTSFSNLKGFRLKNLCLSEVTELLWSEHRERKDCRNTSQKPREFWITFDKQPASCSLPFGRTLPQDNVYIESKNGNIKQIFFLFYLGPHSFSPRAVGGLFSPLLFFLNHISV